MTIVARNATGEVRHAESSGTEGKEAARSRGVSSDICDGVRPVLELSRAQEAVCNLHGRFGDGLTAKNSATTTGRVCR